jgi:hypothetical protein
LAQAAAPILVIPLIDWLPASHLLVLAGLLAAAMASLLMPLKTWKACHSYNKPH